MALSKKDMEKNKTKKIVFLTGTRADFGKIKSLLSILQTSKKFETHIFVTGMHLNPKYGETVREIEKSGLSNIYKFINHSNVSGQDAILSETIRGFSHFVKSLQPDLIVVHGDRVEALGGALVGALNNILVAHIEGGEISGSIDEHIRHAVSKLAHLHFVSNQEAQRRLLQMGEREDTIFVIGSPDIDAINSPHLPNWPEVKKHYNVPFDDFALLMFHPVTTELDKLPDHTNQLVETLLASKMNYIAVYPNNDPGTDIILSAYQKNFSQHPRFALYPSLRFEHFLTILKNTRFVIGNSSAGIREAPYYGIPTINIGSRQNGRVKTEIIKSIKHCDYDKDALLTAIKEITNSPIQHQQIQHFGNAGSDKKFLNVLLNQNIWNIKVQKQFLDIDF